MPDGFEGSKKVISISGAGRASCGAIEFTQKGNYSYRIYEVSGNAAGWTYDKTEYILNCNVSLQDGMLQCYAIINDTSGRIVSDMVFTNVYDASLAGGNISISGRKTWVHGSNPAENQPRSIMVRLYGDSSLVDTRSVTAFDGWSYSFIVPKHNSSGKLINYTVSEDPVPGYKTTVSGFDIKNTYEEPGRADPPIVIKKTEGADAPKQVFRFAFAAVTPGAPMPQGASNGVKIMSLTGAGSLEFGEIAFSHPDTYVYQVYELNDQAPGWTYDDTRYTVTYVVSADSKGALLVNTTVRKDKDIAAKCEFTNVYDRSAKGETIRISGKKTWEYGANDPSNHPHSIVVLIYANGELYMQHRLTAKDNWTYSLDVPKYAKGGKEIVYTIGEKMMYNYTARINGYDIVNTYDPTAPPPTGDTSNAGLWIGLIAISIVIITGALFAGGKKKRK
ncbi:MAG: Cna B-type domain-containing protein [Clostridiales bacterium]|nr:Cna B-type domain-containing protein [Clostridiales bacterium]